MRRRRKDPAEERALDDIAEAEVAAELGEAPPTDASAPDAPGPARGPYDFDDIDPDAEYIDLGSLMLQPPDGLELRLQVDEASGDVAAVLLVAEEGLLEVRAFASSRGGDLWAEARREIAADTARRGGTATEQDGPFGPELLCQVPVDGPNGESLVQPSRIVGHTGPRWFLRATIAGRPAVDADYARPFEEAFATTVVNRGIDAMPPGEPLPLRLPPEARKVD